MELEQYRFGACDAGHAERRRRYVYAVVAYLAAVGYLGVVLVLDATPLVVGLVAPLALGTEWFLQARESLCRRLGLRASSAEPSRCGTQRATQRAARRRAFVLTLAGLATGAVGTGVVVLALWLA